MQANRPVRNPCHTLKIKTGCGSIYIIDNTLDEYPEVFIQIGKSGGCPASFTQFIARLISFCLREGVDKEKIIRAGIGVQCPNPTWWEGRQILSCADAICQGLKLNEILEEERFIIEAENGWKEENKDESG